MSFPWGSLMRAGLGELRLPPAQFWAMTLKELAAATGQEQLDVKSLRRLMERPPPSLRATSPEMGEDVSNHPSPFSGEGVARERDGWGK